MNPIKEIVKNKLIAVIEQYKITKQELDVISEQMDFYIKQIYHPLINEAKTTEQIKEIKESTRFIPESAEKILLFRSILVKEDEIKNGKWKFRK